jgi:hypothetical protein
MNATALYAVAFFLKTEHTPGVGWSGQMMQWLAAIGVVLAVVATGWAVYLRQRVKQLCEAKRELEDHQLEKQLDQFVAAQHREEAVIRVRWTKAGTAAYRVQIENIGDSPAEHVRFHLVSSNGYCPLEPDVMKRLFPVTLSPGEEHVVFALPSRWMNEPFLASVLWQDVDGRDCKASVELDYEYEVS